MAEASTSRPSARGSDHLQDLGLVSVVIPASNRATALPELLARIRGVLEPRAKEIEIIVVVPSPEDPTAEAATAGGASVLAQKRPGYGGALKEGLLASRGDYVVTMDDDLSHPPETITELLIHRDEAEVLVASRYVAGGSAHMSPVRAFLSKALNFVYRRLLAVPVRDMSSRFRIYQRKALNELGLHTLESEKYDILEEILVKIYSLGWRVLEVPFDYQARVSGRSHASEVSFTPGFLSTLFRLWRLRNAFGSADYDSRAYDSLVLPQRYWQRRRFRLVTEMVGHSAPRLDIGCGSSRIIQSAPDSIGLDSEISKLRFLRRTNSLLVRGSAFHLPFPAESFSAAVSSQVIEHLPRDRRIFLEINRVLKPGGTLVIGTPDYGRVQWRFVEWLYKLLLPNAYGDDHITQHTRYGLMEELAATGFSVRQYHYILGGELVVQCVKQESVVVDDPA